MIFKDSKTSNYKRIGGIYDKLFYVYLRQDDPKKSTMKKLERYGFVRRIELKSAARSVVLTPFSKEYITKNDRESIEKFGLTVIDGSWNRIDTIENINLRRLKKLPLLVPVNPVNFGKPGKLSSIEAMAAALYIVGYVEESKEILSKFNWGGTFITTNANLLNDYAQCKDSEEIESVQESYF